MILAPTDPRLSAAFSGTKGRCRFTCSAARYGKGMVLALDRDKTDDGDIYKDDAAWLAEALGGKWARGHQRGYRIAVSRALQWRTLYLAGFEASRRYFGNDNKPYTFSLGDGPKLTLKEALALVANQSA